MPKENKISVVGDYLVLSGSIDRNPFQVDLSPVFVLPDIDYAYETKRGLLEIVLKNDRGTELARYDFKPRVSVDVQSCSPEETGDDDSVTFFELIPYNSETDMVIIEWDGNWLSGVLAGSTPTEVTLTSPNDGEILDGDSVGVTWTAIDDEEGTDLHYRVSYSADDGGSWDLIASGLTETQVTSPQANLPATNRGRFRVWASDGIHTSDDESDNASIIPNRAPYLAITSPISGTIYIISQTGTMQANAYDPDIASLDGDQITWYSTTDGVIGTGDLLSRADLSVGEHTIVAVAVDGQGGMAGDLVNITIFFDAGYLPPLADLLEVAPTSVYFNPVKGYLSQLLEVYNGNLSGTINWEVAVSDLWIVLPGSRVVSCTRDWMEVGVDTTGLDFGVYQCSITITDVENPNNQVIVPVQLYLEPFTVYLSKLCR